MFKVDRNTATKASDDLQRTLSLRGDEHGPDQDDPVNCVAPRHERGVQNARHLGDDLKAEEGGQDEYDEQVYGVGDHSWASSRSRRVCSWCTEPDTVTALPSMISSAKSGASFPSLTSSRTKELTFRA